MLNKKTIICLLIGLSVFLIVSFSFIVTQKYLETDIVNLEQEGNVYNSEGKVLPIKDSTEVFDVGYGFAGMKIKEFKVNEKPITDLNYKEDKYELKTIFKERPYNSVKQDIYLKNTELTKKIFNYSLIIEINYPEVRWRGDKYILTETPVKFGSWIEKDIETGKDILMTSEIFMDEVYHKRITYQDVANKGGYALGYRKDEKYYIELRVDNININAGEEYYIDPVFINDTDGFFPEDVTGITPSGKSIATNGTDFWYDSDAKDLSHVGLAGDGTTRTNVSTCTIDYTGYGIALEESDGSIWQADYSLDRIFHYTSACVNLTDGFKTSTVFGVDNPIAITVNNSAGATDDVYVVVYGATRGYGHHAINGVDQGDGINFTLITGNAGSYYGLYMNDTNFYPVINNEWLVYDINETGTNLSDMFNISTLIGITGGIMEGGFTGNGSNLYMMGRTSKFIYSLNPNFTAPASATTLNAPIDGYNSTNKTVIFNCTTSAVGSNITNVSLYHNASGSWALNQTNSTEIENSSTSLFESMFDFGSYSWNCFGCDENSACSWGTSNRTFDIQKLVINSQTYTTNTIEGSSEDFVLNVTLSQGLTMTDSAFIYDGNSSIAQRFLVGSDILVRVIGFIIPNVVAQTNKSFYWILNLSDSSVTTTDEINQTINNLSISDCSALTNNIFNLTLIDEEHQTNLSENITIETAFDIYSLDRSIILTNFSSNFTTDKVSICLNRDLLNNTNYSLDVIIRYEAQDHANEYYNLVNFSLTNSSDFQNITLFDLLSADSTEFQLTFTGADFVSVENALIYVMRQYISENVFKTVELPKTDSNGQTLLHLVRNDVIYNIQVVKGGEVLGTFNNIIAFCKDYSIGDCKIDLNAFSTGEALFDYDSSLGITFTGPTFDNSTRVMTFNYLTIDGSLKTVAMEVTRNDIFGNRTLCNSTIESSGSTLTCTVPNIDDTLIITTIYVEGEETIKEYTFIDSLNYGRAGYFIFFVFMLAFILMFNKSKTTTLIGIFIGFLGGISLGLIEGAVIGLGASGIWLIVILVLMLWKLNKERQN